MALVLGCIIILCGLAVVYFLFFNQQRTFTITETYKITSTSGSKTYLQVSLPISGGYQDISDIYVKGADDYFYEYFGTWRDLIINVPSVESETIIILSYTAKLFRNAHPWIGPVINADTLPQQFIDSDNEAIIEMAKKLRGKTDFETAQNIHDFVYDLISWPTGDQINKTQLYASELLESPIGVCGDFAILMTALLRAEGIPARSITGLTISLNRLIFHRPHDWGHQGGSHAWVEFYTDGKWHFADPSWGWFNKNRTEHLSFGTYESNINSYFQLNRINEIEEAGFHVIGAMSAPLRFMVYSTDEHASVIPRGDVKFSWFN